MEQLQGKVAVITGGASGIGWAMAERLAAAGMKIALADIEKGPLDEAVSRLTQAGTDAIGVPTDVSDGDQMDALGERVLDHYGAVHVICNNAGVGGGGTMWELTTADWQFVLGVNLWGVIHGVRVFCKHLVAQGEGHIVNTASMAGLVSVPAMGPYNVTKHGVVTLSETLYGELSNAAAGVGVSVLCPGFVNTRIYESQRNRPVGLSNGVADVDPEDAAKRRQMAARFFASAMPAADVAERVHDAVVNDHFYILTHEGSTAGVERRLTNIVDDVNPEFPNAAVFDRKTG